jgi:hypothetical protein
MKFLKNYSREFTVTLFLAILLCILNSPFFILTFKNFMFLTSLGFFLLVFWFVAIYWLYANKKVLRYGEVLLRVRLEEKFFKFFILPSLFYISVALTIFFSKSVVLNMYIISSFALIFFVLLIHVRTSYEKIHYISSLTKIVYDAVIIMLFFLFLFVASSFGVTGMMGVYFAIGLSILLLLYKLAINNQLSLHGYVLIFLSTLLIFMVGRFFTFANIFVFSAVLTVAFYLVVAMWSIRLEGYTKWADYFTPIIYAIMILILIFTL